MDEENKQKIDCSVYSCQYNKHDEQECSLKKIMVAPVSNIDTTEPDESMCASYKYDEEDDWEDPDDQ